MAKSLESSTWKTKTGMVVGKVRYISPEQLNAGSDGTIVDARSDLYSFGVVLYELLTGEFPITGADDMSMIAGHLYRPPRSFEETDPHAKIPPKLRTVVMRALEKSPAHRYPSADDFIQALDAALHGKPLPDGMPADEQPTRILGAETVQGVTQPLAGAAPFTRAAVPQENLPQPLVTQPVASAQPTQVASTDDWQPTRPMRTDGIPAPPAATAAPLSPDAPTAVVQAPTQQLKAPTRSSNKGPLLAGAVAVLALVAAGGWWTTRDAGSASTTGQTSAGADSVAVATDSASTASADIFWGNYHALVIGNNEYQSLPKLEMAVSDAEAVARTLERRFGFQVKLLLNADRKTILDTLYDLGDELTNRDNLLVYYAGHGALVNDSPYWQAVDAAADDSTLWISTEHNVVRAFERIRARHALVVSDSCFAGAVADQSLEQHSALFEKVEGEEPTAELQRLTSRQSRLVWASGGLSPVLDAGAGGHSIFAGALLDALERVDSPTRVSEIFASVKPMVSSGAAELDVEQVPVLAPFTSYGDEGGEFFFVPADPGSHSG